MRILETERLSIRRFTLSDTTFILQLLNDPDWKKYIGDRGVRNLDDARAYLVNGTLKNYRRLGFGFYMVERRSDGVAMGMCGLIKRPRLDDVDIGYAFLPAFRGKGYARESAEAVLAYARDELNLDRVSAIVTPNNERSIQLLEKIGLRYERMVDWPNGDKLKLYVIEFDTADPTPP